MALSSQGIPEYESLEEGEAELLHLTNYPQAVLMCNPGYTADLGPLGNSLQGSRVCLFFVSYSKQIRVATAYLHQVPRSQ